MLVTVTLDPEAPATAAAQLSAAPEPGQAGARPTRINGFALPLGAPSGPSSDGHRYQFAGLPVNADDLVDVVDEHSPDQVLGRLAEPFRLDEDSQLVAASARIFDTQAGRDALVLAAEGVKGGFSVAASFDSYDERDGIRHVPEWRAEHLGVVRRPAFTQSRGLTLAASAPARTHQEGTPAMPTAPEAPPVVELPTIAELAAQVAQHQAEAAASGVHPLAQFPTADAFFAAFQAGDDTRRRELAATFALVDQVTTDNPGLIVPGWRTRIIANLERRRPVIQAFGGPIGLPEGGMDSNWPYYDGDLDSIIERQTAEKEELNSVKISIKKATAPIHTAGVASDISYQLLMRSTPAYLAMYQAICDAAWARYTEAIFETELVTRSTDAGALPAIGAGVKPAAFKSLLFDASGQVEDATGSPATAVAVAKDVWTELGAAELPNPNYPDSNNGMGTSDASQLRVEVNGLQIVRAPFLPAGTVIVGNEDAARFAEQGPMVATEEDVAKLGRNVATWGMYVPAEVYFPAGLLRYDRAA